MNRGAAIAAGIAGPEADAAPTLEGRAVWARARDAADLHDAIGR